MLLPGALKPQMSTSGHIKECIEAQAPALTTRVNILPQNYESFFSVQSNTFFFFFFFLYFFLTAPMACRSTRARDQTLTQGNSFKHILNFILKMSLEASGCSDLGWLTPSPVTPGTLTTFLQAASILSWTPCPLLLWFKSLFQQFFLQQPPEKRQRESLHV